MVRLRTFFGEMITSRQWRTLRIPNFLTAVLMSATVWTPTGARAQEEQRCQAAEYFLVEVVEMTAVSRPDTIDDWRTQAMVPGCRVTAAGATSQSSSSVARGFYEILPESGWARTPDPRDAPNEASLRFRQNGADCLFNFYDASMALNTDAEMMVSDAVFLQAGERLYNFLVMCTPAAPAAPRGAAAHARAAS